MKKRRWQDQRQKQKIWEETIREDTNKKGVGPHNRGKIGVCTEKGEGVHIVKGRKRRSA